MSSSMEVVANRRFPGKASFSQTCSRLSQYLKENGSFGDLNLGVACKPDLNGTLGITRQPTTTMSLFPCEASNSLAVGQDVKPKTLPPRQASFSSSSSSTPKEDVLQMTQTTTRSVKPEPQTAPLTIFYAGQVIVFDGFSTEKAKQVMDLASKGTANSFTGSTTYFNKNIKNVYTSNLAKNKTETISNVVTIPNQRSSSHMVCGNFTLSTGLPIARRASLHRFLEKRKDRVMSKAPYQLCDPPKASSKPQSRGDNKISWLGLAAE